MTLPSMSVTVTVTETIQYLQVMDEVSSAVADGLKRKIEKSSVDQTQGGALKKRLGGRMFDTLHGSDSDEEDSD